MFAPGTRDQIEWLDTPNPGGIEHIETVRGGVFDQDVRPYGRTGVFRSDYMMPQQVATQDYGVVNPDNVGTMPGSVMNSQLSGCPGMGCANCTACRQGMGAVDFSGGLGFVLGAGIAAGMLYLLWYWAKDNRLM